MSRPTPVPHETSEVPNAPNATDPNLAQERPSRDAERIQLTDKYSVTSEFVDELRRRVDGRLAGLTGTGLYTAEQLAGKEFWKMLSSGEQRMAGRCIAYLACRDMLPLTHVEGKHEYPLQYRLK